jgi:hypothetical protein
MIISNGTQALQICISLHLRMHNSARTKICRANEIIQISLGLGKRVMAIAHHSEGGNDQEYSTRLVKSIRCCLALAGAALLTEPPAANLTVFDKPGWSQSVSIQRQRRRWNASQKARAPRHRRRRMLAPRDTPHAQRRPKPVVRTRLAAGGN